MINIADPPAVIPLTVINVVSPLFLEASIGEQVFRVRIHTHEPSGRMMLVIYVGVYKYWARLNKFPDVGKQIRFKKYKGHNPVPGGSGKSNNKRRQNEIVRGR